MAIFKWSDKPALRTGGEGAAAEPAPAPVVMQAGDAPLSVARSARVKLSAKRQVLFSIDHCIAAGPRGVFVCGWAIDLGESLRAMHMTPAGGATRTFTAQELAAVSRADVVRGFAPEFEQLGVPMPSDRCGFALLLPCTGEAVPTQLRIVCELADGSTVAHALAIPQSTDAIAAFLLQEWKFAAPLLGDLIGTHLGSAWWVALAHVAPQLGDSSAARVEFDRCVQIPGAGLFIAGWRVHDNDLPLKLYACTPRGSVREISALAVPTYRQDIYDAYKRQYDLRSSEQGFIALLPEFEPLTEGDVLLVLAVGETGCHGRRIVQIARPSRVARNDIDALLSLFSPSHPRLRTLLDGHVGPAVRALWDGRPQRERVPEVTEFGVPPAAPELSVIVPIYGRWDFIEYQLALFRGDPEMRAHDLVYVIDDPSIYEAVVLYLRSLQPVFEVPFRVVYGRENLGFAGANNLGVSQARGEYLLLLNSDVMPKAPGWSKRLMATYKSLENPGTLAPRLLYQDGSIQHAGMQFHRFAHWGGLWTNMHPGKGLPADSDPARGAVPMDSVTGACLLIRRDLYESVGGFDEDYIVGDFEDSDLCLKLRAAGYRNYYTPLVELYHLERQSQSLVGDSSIRARITLYNCWRHSARWHDTIAAIEGGAHG